MFYFKRFYMAILAIGDVHGQYDALMRLLEQVGYGDDDVLWFVGDLVNRGAQSLQVLRFVTNLKERAVKVLGNHDLSLLVQAQGFGGVKQNKTTRQILQAGDGQELIEAMRYWPLLHIDEAHKVVMAHAGLYPKWSLEQAHRYNNEFMQVLQSADYQDMLQSLFGDKPHCWREDLQGIPRLRFIVNAFCRMRYLDAHGCLDLNEKGTLQSVSATKTPWFRNDSKIKYKKLFGHWASLGFHEENHSVCLDSGAAWQGFLTAFGVDEWQIIGQVEV